MNQIQGQTTMVFPPASRTTNPVTSAMAENEVTDSGARARQAEKVLRLVEQNDGYTSAELAVMGGVDRHMVARRLPDLQHNNLVKKGGRRRCNIGNRQATTWWVV